jgi:LPS O-antigen subunit length determinant protein (WzzB/FepE family)
LNKAKTDIVEVFMVKNSKIDNDEINLIELMCILWEGKWKIAVAVIISLIAVISYQSTKTKNFTAITEIKPISDL